MPPRDARRPDRGCAAALAKVQQDEFNCLGPFSDAKPEAFQELAFMVTNPAGLEAAFKTPGLCNVAMRPPYMHAGQFENLEEVVGHYAKSPAATVSHSELAHGDGAHKERKPIKLTEKEIRDVAALFGDAEPGGLWSGRGAERSALAAAPLATRSASTTRWLRPEQSDSQSAPGAIGFGS